MHIAGDQTYRQMTHGSSSCTMPVNKSLCKPAQSKPPEPSVTASQLIHHSKRQLLMGAASILIAPLLARHAEASPALYNITDSVSSALDGFDGVGGSDADYATAEVL